MLPNGLLKVSLELAISSQLIIQLIVTLFIKIYALHIRVLYKHNFNTPTYCTYCVYHYTLFEFTFDMSDVNRYLVFRLFPFTCIMQMKNILRYQLI